jgi:hypothetical protein
MVQSYYGPEAAEPAAVRALITAARLVKSGRNPWKLIVSALTLTTRWAKIFLPKCFSESKLFSSLNVLLPIGMAFVAASGHDGLDIDAVEELARFERPSVPGLASLDNVFGAANGGGGIYRQHLADHRPVEQHADGGEPLLDGRRRRPATDILDPSRDVHRFDVKQLDEAGLVAPVEEFAGGPVIGFARVRVADVGGEEFDEAPAGVAAARGDQCRHRSVMRG